MPHTIRRAVSADVPALATLAEHTFVETFGPAGFGIPYPEADLRQFLAESYSHAEVTGWITDPSAYVIVAEEEGRLVGYAQSGLNTLPLEEARPGDGELKRIYVRREAQGAGLGRTLLEQSLDWLGTRPILIGVWCGNDKAQRLYARYGFEKVGEHHFMVGTTADADFILRRG